MDHLVRCLRDITLYRVHTLGYGEIATRSCVSSNYARQALSRVACTAVKVTTPQLNQYTRSRERTQDANY